MMDTNFLKAHAERCRSLAEKPVISRTSFGSPLDILAQRRASIRLRILLATSGPLDEVS
jgi:hypothetical protein